MAIYRQMHTTYWKDELVGEFTQLQKLFYIYLLTNDRTTQSGLYEFSHRYASFEIGITQKEVAELLHYFVAKKRIRFNPANNEVLIINWLKYNSAKSPKVAAVIDRELQTLKTIEFKLEVVMNCLKLNYPITTNQKELDGEVLPEVEKINSLSQNADTLSEVQDTLFQNSDTLSSVSDTLSQTPDTLSQQHSKEQHNTSQHNNQQQQQQGTSAPTAPTAAARADSNPFEFYQNNFGVMAPTVRESLAHWVADLNAELVIEALKRAVSDQKGFRYAEGILRNWAKKNLQSLTDVQADDQQFSRRKKFTSTPKRRQESLPEWSDKPFVETPVNPEVAANFKAQLAEIRQKKPK